MEFLRRESAHRRLAAWRIYSIDRARTGKGDIPF